MALTTDDIHNTADALFSQGIKPTLAKVRDALGGGSFTTISEAMQSWRAQHKTNELPKVALPDGLSQPLHELGIKLWQMAYHIAQEQLAVEREAMAQRQDDAQSQLQETLEAMKTLEAEQDKAQVIQQDLQQQLEGRNTALSQAEMELAKLKGELSALIDYHKQVIQERDTLNQQLVELTAKVTRLETQREYALAQNAYHDQSQN